MKPLYAALVVRQLAAQASMRLRPSLAAQPLAIVQGARPHERLYSANATAVAHGLCPGMTRVEIESFAGVHILPRSTAEEQAAVSILLEALALYTPRLEPLVSATPDWEAFLDLSGTELLLGAPAQFGAKILNQLKTIGFTAAIAVTANPDASLSLARAAKHPVTTVSAQPLRDALAPLPLATLNLNAEEQERFAIWGIETLGELAALPERDLITRLGQAGRRLRQRALGELPHLLQPILPAFDLAEAMDFDDSIETLEPLLFLLNPMLEQLLIRAQSRALALAAITVTLTLYRPADRALHETPQTEPGSLFTRTIRPAIPTTNQALLLKMLQLDLEANPPPGAISRLHLAAEPGQSSRIQLGFFAPPIPEPTRFEDTHARLIALVGEANVGRITPTDTHAPDPFRIERFKLPRALDQEPAPRSQSSQPTTALRRLRPPVSIHVQAKDARTLTTIFYDARRFEVLRCFGPWRSSGDWWNQQNQWSLDTWDLALKAQDDGELLLCVVAFDLLARRWQLEGIYD